MTSAPLSPDTTIPRGLYGAPAVLAMLGICLVTMLVAFDQTVVGVALPRIVADLNGFSLYSWVATSYLLLSSIFVPIMGRLGDLFGRKRFVLGSIVIFTASSMLCGMAGSMLALVGARALQGIGGGMLVGTAFAATADIFPDQMRRIRWQAMLSSAFGVANAIGPSLGGWLTEHWGWRSVFFVNLPIGLAALFVVGRYLPRIRGHRTDGASIDWPGALWLAATIGALLFALEAGAKEGIRGFLSPPLWLYLIGALVVGGLFLRSQRRAAQPILPLRLFDLAAVRGLATIGALSGWAMFSLIFYAPLLLQAGFGLSPNRAGIIISPLVVFISVGSITNGRLYGRLQRPHRLLGAGILLFLGGILSVLAVQPGVPVAWISVAFALCGFGLGFQLPNLTIQMQAAVERRDIGVASALVQTLRMLGSMTGAAIAGVIVTGVYQRGVALALEGAGTAGAPFSSLFRDPQVLVSTTSAAQLRALATTPESAAVLTNLFEAGRHALVLGVHSALWISVVLCVIAWLWSRRLPNISAHREDAVTLHELE